MSPTKKPAARKPAVKKPPKKKPAAKVVVARKPGAKNPVSAKPAAKKPAAKKTTDAKKEAAPKPTAQQPAAPKAALPRKSVAPRRGASAKAPRTLAEFMAQAWAMEIEAAQRYADFADAMETHNNLEAAAMFRKMAGYESKHADQILAEMGWTRAPEPPAGGYRWQGFEAPETVPIDEVHYLMQPWHALQLALACEERAVRFFAALAEAATDDSVRNAARELEAEEREHVALVKAWLAKMPKPDSDWANDPDPPHYTD